jgi:hypothetical protein
MQFESAMQQPALEEQFDVQFETVDESVMLQLAPEVQFELQMETVDESVVVLLSPEVMLDELVTVLFKVAVELETSAIHAAGGVGMSLGYLRCVLDIRLAWHSVQTYEESRLTTLIGPAVQAVASASNEKSL